MNDSNANLGQVLGVFFKLGCIGFGGPAAHIAMMEEEVVRRRHWLSREKFLDLLGATNLIPGPNSTEMAIHVGHQVAGWRGLVAAGAAFILPAAVLTTLAAWAYVEWGTLPRAAWVLYGVKPVVIAVVIQALWSLGRSAIKGWGPGLLAMLAAMTALAGGNELAILGAAGAAWGLETWLRSRGRPPGAAAAVAVSVPALASAPASALAPVTAPASAPVTDTLAATASATVTATAADTAAAFASPGAAILGAAAASSASAASAAFGLWPLFIFFVKVGSVLYGSGYVLLAFLEADLVERLGWLTHAQLLDAVAVGQITPGPVFTTATFIGYILGGLPGAVVATIGIFLPAFVFVALSGPLIPRIRNSPVTGAVLDGVIAASLGLMAAVTVDMGRAVLVDVPSVLLAVAAGAALLRFKANSAWLVLGGALVGLAVSEFK